MILVLPERSEVRRSDELENVQGAILFSQYGHAVPTRESIPGARISATLRWGLLCGADDNSTCL